MTARFCLLVVAKAPVPGFAKTRLCPPASPDQAAEIAAAALLDTLDAVAATPGAVPVVAVTGDFATAARSAEIRRALTRTTVLDQRGGPFGERLANAHADTAARHPGLPVLQIGMDTPQVRPELLAAAAADLAAHQAVLGRAPDGGWWALGLRDPAAARVLADVPMSRSDTGDRTHAALSRRGAVPRELAELSDVDTMADARAVASVCRGRFPAAVAAVTR
ncbi:TIGR04282 family arsenosugar biosynthesis glycosyltransferase [Amycolatopsis thermoflava]|uniref:TIGR04282 family arsenosugar biosynthesis glycosyltransferase n=1 Tax=Amycolatopsis thermoflava TaxID=84480 RepID=UPI00365FD82B